MLKKILALVLVLVLFVPALFAPPAATAAENIESCMEQGGSMIECAITALWCWMMDVNCDVNGENY